MLATVYRTQGANSPVDCCAVRRSAHRGMSGLTDEITCDQSPVTPKSCREITNRPWVAINCPYYGDGVNDPLSTRSYRSGSDHILKLRTSVSF